jgi:hypothetical protein
MVYNYAKCWIPGDVLGEYQGVNQKPQIDNRGVHKTVNIPIASRKLDHFLVGMIPTLRVRL